MTEQQAFAFAPGPQTPPRPDGRRNLVIEAGAGTGKTTAIVAEVLKLMLEREDLAPERIVLMTFTEKAAGEIADRIRGALEELSRQLQSGEDGAEVVWPAGSASPLVRLDDRQQAARAIARHLGNIDAIRSQTIHSFCQSLLRGFPIEAGLDPQFKIVEGFERSLLYGQIYDAWLDHETRVEPDETIVREWELLFTHAGYLFQIRDLILTLVERRDLLNETGYGFGDFHEHVLPILSEAVLWIRGDATRCKDPAAAQVAAYLRETALPAENADDWLTFLQPIAAPLRNIDLRYCGSLKEPMASLRSGAKGDSIYEFLASHRAAMALLSLTRRFLAFLDEEKRKLGLVDFDDLLLRTLAVLDDPQVLSRARSQFDFIFVDEFQDTDRTQARIIDRLIRNDAGEYEPGKAIVVGDPKQSIYGFRRADPETYHRMTESLEAAGAERRFIEQQYRSDPSLVETINAMFVRLFPDQPHDPNVFRPPYRPLRAARPASLRELDARITLLHAQHEERSDRYFAEAESIAGWIQARRDGGPLDLQRFAILFRRLTIVDDYLETLRRHGIDYVLPPTRSFLDRRAPVDLLAVLRAIAYPFDRGAQISAARTPYFALTDIEIAEGILAAGQQEQESGGAWTAFNATLEALRLAAPHLTVSQLIEHVLETTGIAIVYESTAGGARDLAHLEHVRAIAFEYDQRTGGSVQQFVDEIAHRRDDPEEMEPGLLDETQNAVRILTVHAAKGLEFETVILPDLAFQTSGNETLQLFTVEEPRTLVLAGRAQSISANFLEAGGEKLKKLSKQRDDAETARLFYVAVTRAKSEVVFVVNAEEKKSTGFARSLATVLGDIPADWPECGREVRPTDIGPVAFERIEAPAAGPPVRQRLRDAVLEASLAESTIVPLALGVPLALVEHLPAGELAARRAGARNRAAGILLHRALELWDGRAALEPLLAQLALEAGAGAETVSRVRQRLATVARSPVLRRILAAETIGRELPIRFVENGLLVERRIDRLLREGEREFVLDYKTGTAEPSRVEKDRLQVQRYAAAISTMTGRPCDGLLWYIDLETDSVVSC